METENPYSAPAARVSEPEIPTIVVSDEVLKKIKRGWIAALFSGGVTLTLTLLAMSGTEMLGYSALELFDVALILGLAFGIYKKSRTCAVLMLVYFIASKIFIMVDTGKPSGMFMGLIFTYFFWQAVSGTFAYHKAKRDQLTQAVVTSGRG